MASCYPTVFTLKTAMGGLEVSQFTIENWGVSCEYTIYLTLNNPDWLPRLTDVACLHFDAHYFHGFIGSICDVSTVKMRKFEIRLLSPLQYFLQHYHTRILTPQPLDALLSTVLSESGLNEGVDFEVRFTKNKPMVWYKQINMPTLSYLQTCMTNHGVGYYYQQTIQFVRCIISDDVMAHLPSNPVTLNAIPFSGFGDNARGVTVNQQTSLCSFETTVCQYDATLPSVLSTQAESEHGFTLGKARTVWGCQTAKTHQALTDEQAQRTTIVLNQLLLAPGQPLNMRGALCHLKKAKVRVLAVHGMQEKNKEARVNKAGEKHYHARLKVSAQISEYLTGLNGEEMYGYSLMWSRARVEGLVKGAPALCEAGHYRIRLVADDAVRGSANASASPFVRNALPFLGNYYGFSMPFRDDSEVVVAADNYHFQWPVVIGGLSNNSVVTAYNAEESILKSTTGNSLCLSASKTEPKITLATADNQNALLFDADIWSLCSLQGGMNIDSLRAMIKLTKAEYLLRAKVSIYSIANYALRLSSKEEDITLFSAESTTMRCEKESHLNAKNHYWNAQKNLRMRGESKCMIISDKALNIQSDQGAQHWQSCTGNIFLMVKSNLMLQGGASTMQLTAQQLKFTTPEKITFDACVTKGLDNAK